MKILYRPKNKVFKHVVRGGTNTTNLLIFDDTPEINKWLTTCIGPHNKKWTKIAAYNWGDRDSAHTISFGFTNEKDAAWFVLAHGDKLP